jgi:hypothetical protein
MLRDFRAHAAEPTVRSTASHDGARPTSDDATRPCKPEHNLIRAVIEVAIADVIEYARGSPGALPPEQYAHRQAVLWMAHVDDDDPPPWSFDWCCLQIGADPGQAFKAINRRAISARERDKR